MTRQVAGISYEDLTEYFIQGCKDRKNFSIGTEHEKFGYHLGNLKPLHYSGSKGGIRDLLE